MSDKMKIHNVVHTIFYIDPNKAHIDNAVEGDGSSVENAAFNFPTSRGTEVSNNQEINDNVVYLVRKSVDGYFAQLPYDKSSDDVTSLVIIGMPSEGEKYWDDLPAEVKSKWGGDEGSACVCKYMGNSYPDDTGSRVRPWTLPSCKNFTMYNVRFMTCNSDHRQDFDWCIRMSSSYGTNLDIQNCEFGEMLEGEDGRSTFYDFTPIEHNPAFVYADGKPVLADNPSVTSSVIWSTETQPKQLSGYYTACRYIDAIASVNSSPFSNIVVIKNVTINTERDNAALNVGKPRNLIIENVVFNTVNGSYQTAAIHWGHDDFRAPTVSIRNVKVYYYFCDGWGCCYLKPVFSGRVDRIDVNNVVVKPAKRQTVASIENKFGPAPIIDIVTRFTGSEFKNIYIDIPHVNGTRGSVFSCTYNNDYTDLKIAPSKQYSLVKDIYINAYDVKDSTKTESTEIEFSPMQVKYGIPDDPDNPTKYTLVQYSKVGENIEDGDPFYADYPGLLCLGHDNSYMRVVSSEFLVQNININAYRGVAMRVSSAILDLTDTTIRGAISLQNSVGKIYEIESYYPGYLVRDNGNNLLYIQKLKANLDNEVYGYNSQPSVSDGAHTLSGRSHLLINTSVGNCWPSTYWDPQYPHSYVCTNDGTTGNYSVRTGRSSARTWSAHRVPSDTETDATGCSLKLVNESADDWHWPLRIGCDPFKGIVKSVEDEGKYNATFFLALYNYYGRYDEIKDRLFIRIKLPDGSYVYSNEGVCERDTTSVWDGVEGTTNYKFVIPLDIKKPSGFRNGIDVLNIEIDFTWSFYMLNTATFLDPYPTLEKIVEDNVN